MLTPNDITLPSQSTKFFNMVGADLAVHCNKSGAEITSTACDHERSKKFDHCWISPSIVTSASQLSVAVATANTGVAGQLIVEVAGSAAITGAVLSCTFMVCEAVEKFPHASVAVHVLVIEYDHSLLMRC